MTFRSEVPTAAQLRVLHKKQMMHFIISKCWLRKSLGESGPYHLHKVDIANNQLSNNALCIMMNTFKSLQIRVDKVRHLLPRGLAPGHRFLQRLVRGEMCSDRFLVE